MGSVADDRLQKSNPLDCAIAQSFFKTSKEVEVFLLKGPVHDELAVQLPEFLDRIHNSVRPHPALGPRAPAESEAKVKKPKSRRGHRAREPSVGAVLQEVS